MHQIKEDGVVEAFLKLQRVGAGSNMLAVLERLECQSHWLLYLALLENP